MTIERAIEALQDMHDVAECRIKNGDKRGGIYIPPEDLDSYIIAIEALEKQIPKKPTKDKYNHNCCPNCEWIIFKGIYDGDEYVPHCENCGQALDWNDKNDNR